MRRLRYLPIVALVLLGPTSASAGVVNVTCILRCFVKAVELCGDDSECFEREMDECADNC